MEQTEDKRPVVRAGDLDGLGKVYSEWGGLITKSGEEILNTFQGWDIDVSSPWRKVLPKVIFPGFQGKASSKLFVTTDRLVLVREIDVWRELKEELSPLGIPAAAAKEIHLRRLKSAGARQFCEIWPRNFRVVKIKRIDKRWSSLDLRLLGIDGRRYEVIISKTDGLDPVTLTFIQSQFTS
jgi:hypothetical protein